MRVKDIIKQVCKFIERYDIITSIENEEDLSEEQKETTKLIIEGINLVRNEIASEYIPNIKIEKTTVEDGKVDFSRLSSGVIEILSVKDQFGLELDFEKFDNYITLSGRHVEVKYNASPEIVDFEDEFSTTIPMRVLGYGVMREYNFIQTLYEDANMWEVRFKNSLQSLTRKKSGTIIAKRRWE